jgi:hypothetical protein
MMWENVARDVEDARNDLTLRRTAVLERHAAELKELDNERDEIESFTRVAAAFAKRYKVQKEPTTAETTAEVESSAVAQENSDKAEAKSGTRTAFTPNFSSMIRRAS